MFVKAAVMKLRDILASVRNAEVGELLLKKLSRLPLKGMSLILLIQILQ